MVILLFGFSLLFTLVSFIKNKKWYHPILLFNILYTLTLGLLIFDIFNYSDPSNLTILVIFLGIFSMNFGGYFGDKIKVEHKNFQNKIKKKSLDIIILILQVILLIFYSFEFLNILPLYLSGVDLSYIRGVYFEGNPNIIFLSNNFWFFSRVYIQEPLFLVTMVYSTIYFIKYDNKRSFFIFIALIFIKLLFTAGRFSIIYLLISVMVTLGFYNKYFSKRFKFIKNKANLIILLLIAVTFSVSIIRGVTQLGTSLYIYLTGYLPLLSNLLDILQYENYVGILSFFGIISPFFFFSNNILGIPYSNFYISAIEIRNLTSIRTDISSEGISYNAFATPFFTLYADLGLLGVFLGMFIWGLISSLVYKIALRNFNDGSFAILLLFIVPIVKSLQEYPFSNASFIIALILSIIIKPIYNNFENIKNNL
jgi:oligosaccharide repeat unit polymerase